MGIRFYCPSGHKLNVKDFQAGRKGICPFCGARVDIPLVSTRKSSRAERRARRAGAQAVEAAEAEDSSPETALQPAAESQPAAQPTAARSAPAPQPSPAESRPSQPQPQPAPARPQPIPVTPTPVQPTPVAAASEGPAPAGFFSGPVPAAEPGKNPLESVEPAPATFRPLPSDPLTESPRAVWYVRPPSGGQFGPAMADVMRNWLAEGRVSADSLVWREGWRDWQEAGAVFPQLGSASWPSPAVPPVDRGHATADHARLAAAHRRAKNRQLAIVGLLVATLVVLTIVFLYMVS